MKNFRSILWLKLMVLVCGGLALAALPSSRWGETPLAYAGVLCAGVFLWMVSNLCADIRMLRNALEMAEPQESKSEGELAAILATPGRGKDPSEALVEMAAGKRLGDRIFKADATKTCQSCKSLRPDERTCALDGASLQGTTIGAVGCQHWTPGLRLTSTVELIRPEEPPEPATPQPEQP
jgi:hypothetical protein